MPPADHANVADAAHHAFVTGFNTVALVSVAVAGYALVRSRDFVGADAAAAPAPEPVRA